MFAPWLLDVSTQAPAIIHLMVGIIAAILGTIELCRTETLCIED